MGLSPDRSSGRIFFFRVSFVYWLLFWYLFLPCVTAVACKRIKARSHTCNKGDILDSFTWHFFFFSFSFFVFFSFLLVPLISSPSHFIGFSFLLLLLTGSLSPHFFFFSSLLRCLLLISSSSPHCFVVSFSFLLLLLTASLSPSHSSLLRCLLLISSSSPHCFVVSFSFLLLLLTASLSPSHSSLLRCLLLISSSSPHCFVVSFSFLLLLLLGGLIHWYPIICARLQTNVVLMVNAENGEISRLLSKGLPETLPEKRRFTTVLPQVKVSRCKSVPYVGWGKSDGWWWCWWEMWMKVKKDGGVNDGGFDDGNDGWL